MASSIDASADGKIRVFVKWLEENGADLSKIEIRSSGSDGNGVFARQAILENEPYAWIPYKLVITDSVCQSMLPETLDIDLHGRPMLCTFLIHERFVAKDKSFWKPYIDILPPEFHTPLHFSEEELALLKGTPVEFAVDGRRELYTSEYKQALAAIPSDIMPRDVFTFENYLWAATVCSSRAFSKAVVRDDADKHTAENEVLLPLLDMMNHYPMRRVSWVTSEDGVEFVTRAALDEGDQVYNNYGPKSNEELMMGYGFCIKNNPFSYFHIKLNYSQDPLAGQKQQILGRAGLSESSQYIRLGELPRDLLPMLRVMAMSDVDVYFACSLDATVARESLAYVSLRNEIRARNLLIFLLEKKLANFQSAEADIPSISSDNASVAREYRKEIHDILCSTLADLKSAMQQLLGFGCSLFKLGKHSLPSYACSEGFVPFDKTSHSPDDSNANGGSSPKASHVKKARVSNSEERFAKEVLVTAAAFERDLEFYEAIQQIDVEEDTLYVLFLIRALFSNTLPWSAAVKRLEEFKHPMQLYEQDSAVVESYGEMMLEMGEIYESLFPLLTEHFPQVFPAAQYTQERFLWAAGIVESFRVVVPVWQGGNGDEIEGLCLI